MVYKRIRASPTCTILEISLILKVIENKEAEDEEGKEDGAVRVGHLVNHPLILLKQNFFLWSFQMFTLLL